MSKWILNRWQSLVCEHTCDGSVDSAKWCRKPARFMNLEYFESDDLRPCLCDEHMPLHLQAEVLMKELP